MTKRLIGIDIGPKSLRVAVLTASRGDIALSSVSEHPYEAANGQIASLHEHLGGNFAFGDQVAACLPASAAFTRQLSFPFSSQSKIFAALPYELSRQLPISLEDYTTAMCPPHKSATGSEVLAAAIKTAKLEAFLQPFDEAQVPLQHLDLAPYAYFAGLKDFLSDGILACVMEQESALLLIQAGTVVLSRQQPLADGQTLTQQADALCREARSMQQASPDKRPLPIFLMGARASAELAKEMSSHWDRVELLAIRLGDEQIEAPFLPAVALALRAACRKKALSFNLRQGRFALKSEWAGLRKTVIQAASLAGLTLLVLGVAMSLQYTSRSKQAKALQAQMVQVYRDTVPGATAIVDVQQQMQSALRALQEESGQFNHRGPSPISLLEEMSDLPDGVAVDLDDFALEQNTVRISGRTDSFEAVNRLAEKLRQSPIFAKVEVSEAKMSVTDQQVLFRMTLVNNEEGAQ